MATRLVVASDEDVKAFSEQPENENTKKTGFQGILENCDETKANVLFVSAEQISKVCSERG